MSLYDELGEKYDMMIRWKQRLEKETPFFQRLFSENRVQRVLDLACGTGHHSRLFHNWGCDVTGVDPSSALLEVAKSKIPDNAENIKFIESDFSAISSNVEGPFDAILCLGNSLPHIDSVESLQRLFTNVLALLKPGGAFVFQNRNYDRLVKHQERFQFPSTYKHADNEQIFFRFNDFEGDKVRFNVVHFTRVGESWIHEVHSTELLPLKQSEVADILHKIGFVANDFYGDFSGTPFDAESSADFIGLARKSNTNF